MRVPAMSVRLFAALLSLSLLMPSVVRGDELLPPPAEPEEPPPAEGSIGVFHALPPGRLLDTRSTHKMGPGESLTVDATGRGGVPSSGVQAVALNVTVRGSTAASGLTLWPKGTTRPNITQLSFGAGEASSNLVTTKVGDGGNLRIYNRNGYVHVIVHVVGWYHGAALDHAVASPFHPLRPGRLLDTRPGSKLGSGESLTFDATGRGGVPSTGVRAVALNITVRGSTAASSLTIWPKGAARPSLTQVAFGADDAVTNLVTTKVGDGGNVRIYNKTGRVDVIVHVVGWYGGNDLADGGQHSALRPGRLLDTRNSDKLGAGESLSVDATGRGGVPSKGVQAVLLNVTARGATRASALTLWPKGTTRPNLTQLTFGAGEAATNLVTAKVGDGGNVRIYNKAGRVDVIVHVVGWFTTAGFEPADATGSAADAVESISGPIEMVTIVAESVDAPAPGLVPATRPEPEIQHHPNTDGNGIVNLPDAAGYTNAIPQVGRLYSFVNGAYKGTCSGTIVARNLVLTAAHCIAGSTAWHFYPGQYGTVTSGGVYWESTSGTFPSEFLTSGGAWTAFDWGFLSFNSTNASGQYIGDVHGWYEILYNSTGGPKWSMGYPSEGWFSTYCSTNYAGSCYPYYCFDRITDANAQYLKNLNDTSVSHGGWWEVQIGCYMTGGASGGPLFEYYNGAWYVNGVNSHLQRITAPMYSCPGNDSRPYGCYQWSDGAWSPYFNHVIVSWRNSLAIT